MRAAIVNEQGIIENIIIVNTVDDVLGSIVCPDGLDIGQHIDTVVSVPIDLSAKRLELCTLVDDLAGRTRSKHITHSIGQEATYTEKARQCELYKANGFPDQPDLVLYSYVIAEANARGSSMYEACVGILAERDAWGVLGAKIEECRRKTKIDINTAVSEDLMMSIYYECERTMSGL